MALGTLDPTPIIRVNHKTARFESDKASSTTIAGRVMAMHYGRKKFAQASDGKWSLDCVSSDARQGDSVTGETVTCMSSTSWCADCKSTLCLAIATKSGGVIVETSASVAATIRDRLVPLISRGIALDSVILRLHLGLSQSSRMTFAQCSTDITSDAVARASNPRLDPDQLPVLLDDFADHIRTSFAMRLPNTSRPDLSGAELSV